MSRANNEISFLRVCCPRFRGPPVVAQDYPTRPIRVITATSAGGTSDIFMRVIGEEIHKRWGQPSSSTIVPAAA